MAKKELSCTIVTNPLTCSCLKTNGYGFNYEITRSGKGIKFNNYQDICQEFFWDTSDNRLKEIKRGGEAIPLTPDDFEIISFKFGPITSWDQNNNEQPRVTLFLEIKAGKGHKTELQPKIQIQTTLSQRNLDVKY